MADQQSIIELGGWGIQPAGMGFWGDGPYLLEYTTTQTQTGLARIALITSRTITGISRIRPFYSNDMNARWAFMQPEAAPRVKEVVHDKPRITY